MSNHPVGIATMAALFAAFCAVLLIATVALTLRLDRRRQAAVTRARAEAPVTTPATPATPGPASPAGSTVRPAPVRGEPGGLHVAGRRPQR